MRPFKKLENSIILTFIPVIFSFQTGVIEAFPLEEFVKLDLQALNYLTKNTSPIKLSTQLVGPESAELGVRDYLGDSRYDYLLQNNPGLISDLKLRFEYGVQLIDWNVEKAAPYKTLTKINLIYKESNEVLSSEDFVQQFESGQINPLRVELPIDNEQQGFFILANTGKALVMNSWQQMRYLQQTATN